MIFIAIAGLANGLVALYGALCAWRYRNVEWNVDHD